MTLSKRDMMKGAAGTLIASVAGAAAPATSPGDTARDRQQLAAYFHASAPKLLRPSAGVLRHPSIALSLPSSTYSGDLWDWDTLCTAQGLFSTARLVGDAALTRAVAEHARGSLANFFDHQSAEGRIPMVMQIDHPDPLGCLSGKPREAKNQAKPVLAQLALLVAQETGEFDWFAPMLSGLMRFYQAWFTTNASRSGLFVWSNDVAIGTDNDPTTFARPPFSSGNLLLNCLFFADLGAAAVLAGKLGRTVEQSALLARREALGRAVHRECWDPRDGFFYTADVQCVDRRAELVPGGNGMATSWTTLPLRIQMFTGFVPMWCGLANRDQAAQLIRHYRNPQTFFAAGGVRTLSRQETMYTVQYSEGNPSNWLGPVWLISNYLVWRGLTDYGYRADAQALAARTLAMLAADLQRSGSLNENYHPETALPLSHAGFMDWNLLAIEMS